MNPARRIWLAAAYYLSWLLFGAGGLLHNLGCILFVPFARDDRFGPRARAITRWLFDFWLRWFHASKVADISFQGFDPARLPSGTIYVANHPTLIDAPLLLARLPDTICIFKPALLRNPVVGPAAILCGYVAGAPGVDGIRAAAERVAAGRSLLIFPEGTRTAPGESLNPLRSGFALIARRARAPIQIIHVVASRDIAAKGRCWWRVPALPARFDFYLGELIPADTSLSVAESTEFVAARLRAAPPASP